MSADQLDAFEVLLIAVRIEQNGAQYYRAAAQMVDDPKASSLLGQLAQWEQRHIQVFSDMRDRLSRQGWERGTFEPRRMEVSDAQMMAGLAVFGIRPQPSAELTGKETRRDILSYALKKEKDTVTFYEGLKDFVFMPEDQDVIDQVLEEERHHVRLLATALEQGPPSPGR